MSWIREARTGAGALAEDQRRSPPLQRPSRDGDTLEDVEALLAR